MDASREWTRAYNEGYEDGIKDSSDELIVLLKEARKIIRASSSRNLVKDWDERATKAIAAHGIKE